MPPMKIGCYLLLSGSGLHLAQLELGATLARIHPNTGTNADHDQNPSSNLIAARDFLRTLWSCMKSFGTHVPPERHRHTHWHGVCEIRLRLFRVFAPRQIANFATPCQTQRPCRNCAASH